MIENTETVTPDLDEVEQQESRREMAETALPVHLDGPARVQQLPCRVSVMRSISLGSTTELIAGRDLRRARIVLVSADQPVYLGQTTTEVANGSGFLMPSGQPLELLNAATLYARCSAPGMTTILSILIEQWAD